MAKGVKIVSVPMRTIDITCALIGDRYIAFENINSYLYTCLSRKYWPADDRIACVMVLVGKPTL
jgi:hypothetical protein